jgi:CheY-like chemotaxis protein
LISRIFRAASALKDDKERFMVEGMDGYVTKPVDFGELARPIAEVCMLVERSNS